MTSEDLRIRRDSLGVTQGELAEALGVTRQSVYMWEAGKTNIPALLDLALRYIELKAMVCDAMGDGGT
jgi:DNA-binding XRE family transcriptional regulator